VFEAHPGHNTWGAYQAYGDPAFQLKVHRNPASDDPLRSSHELVDWIEQRRIECRLPDAGQMFQRGGKDDGFKQIARRIQTRLRHVPEGWIKQPQVQHALARLYAEFGQEGYPDARSAWLRAIGDDSSRARALFAIEQLANLESRQAERLSASRLRPKTLAESALARLHFLIALSSESPEVQHCCHEEQPERWASSAAPTSAWPSSVPVVANPGTRWRRH
jgi:hypothetical protein